MPGNVAVVGAGLAGLVAARALAEAGRRVTVLEQASEPGGRLATRQVGGATLDSGAQFFTIREAAFDRLVGSWRRAGAPVRVWSYGFARADSVESGPRASEDGPDDYPRYVVDGGMQELARRLADGLDVRTGRHVTAIAARAGGWRVETADGAAPALEADALVLTPPGDQCAKLLAAPLPVPRPIEYQATVALLAALDGPAAVPSPGGVQFESGPVAWLADNEAKGISARPALTVHASAQESAVLLDLPDQAVGERLWERVEGWAGDARPVEVAVERWRHSQPTTVHAERTVAGSVDGAPLLLAGDAFGGPRVEGAALSGLAAASLA